MQDRKRETADALQNVGGDSPRKRRAITHTFIIIALSGTVCKGKKSSAKRVFTGSYGILTNRPYHYAGVRTRARAVAEWLSGEGLLVFDDEPEKAYSAKVVGGISIEQIAVTGTCEVRFLCKPFAESLRYNQQDVKSVSLPHTEAVNVRGTQETDGLIYITARGNIQTLTITRLKVN